jgi:hypothetical protein
VAGESVMAGTGRIYDTPGHWGFSGTIENLWIYGRSQRGRDILVWSNGIYKVQININYIVILNMRICWAERYRLPPRGYVQLARLSEADSNF